MNYKGQLLEQGTNWVFGLIFIGILMGAGGIALSSFGASTTDATATAVIGNSSTGLLNLSLQLPVIGTIAGVALLISVLVVGIGGYFFSRR